MKTQLALILAFALQITPAAAQTPAPETPTEAQLLKQQLELLKQRLDALETQNAAAAKAAAEAQAAAAAATAEAKAATEAAAEAIPPEPAPYVEPWLLTENWKKILRGSDESIVKGLLGRPNDTQMGAAGNTWIYQDPEQPQLGRGTVRFAKGRGAIDWEPPASAR
ncbi:MAG: hypothetical protein AABY95_09215 [Pseudomonadota bacterium]